MGRYPVMFFVFCFVWLQVEPKPDKCDIFCGLPTIDLENVSISHMLAFGKLVFKKF